MRTPGYLAIALGLVLGAAPATGAAAAPLHREPPTPGVSVPNPGLPPPRLPVLTGAPAAPQPAALPPGPQSALLTAVRTRTAALERLGEQLSEQDAALAAARAELAGTTRDLALAEQELADRQREADGWARRAYMSAQQLPGPLQGAPALAGVPDTLGAEGPDTAGLAHARSAVDTARAAYQRAADADQRLARTVALTRARYDTGARDLAALRTRHADQLAAAQALLDAHRQQAGEKYLAAFGVQGGAAGPAALRAVTWALAQRGKPYVWGAEGPDAFDCSGLVQAAYAAAGIRLPRTARPQWRATRGVPTSALVAGDLLFFATDASNWDSIHHVGIYLGAGKMLHAPQSGDVVRIAPVWWEEFFGATRVVPAVSGPSVLPPLGAPKPPRPPKPATPGPKPGSPSPSTPPSPSGSPSPSPSPSPSGSPSPSTSPPTTLAPSLLAPLATPIILGRIASS
jgi:cell wall-associated NlpC family hydrolase